jgi:hypothetical protein
MIPKDQAEDEESYTCEDTKYAPTGAVEEVRET